jgi:UDP-glucose 4-epimerase
VFARLYGLQFVALRYANVYGPRQDPHGEAGVVAVFAQRLLDGRDTVINGDGTQTRDYVSVDDVVTANLLAAGSAPPGAYNIGTARECSVTEIRALIARAAGVEREAVYGAAQPGEQRRSCVDVSRAAELLGWRPRVSLADGIARTVAWFAGAREQ